jgi:hypothetical protein
MRDVLYNIIGRVKYEHKYGTPPIAGTGKLGGKIENVTDAEAYIRSAIKKKDQGDANDAYYSGMEKLGDMHIYGHKPMEFIPAS